MRTVDISDQSSAASTSNGQSVRVFVGLKVVPDIARELLRYAHDLEREAVRPIAVADVHLTLVPPWQEVAHADAIEKLSSVADRFAAFALTFEHVGYGPQPRRPHLLWVECALSEEILALHAALNQVFGQNEQRPFRPHVTLARIRGNGSRIARKHPIDEALRLTQRVESVEFFQSPPRGETGYRVLASCRLGGALLPACEPE